MILAYDLIVRCGAIPGIAIPGTDHCITLWLAGIPFAIWLGIAVLRFLTRPAADERLASFDPAELDRRMRDLISRYDLPDPKQRAERERKGRDEARDEWMQDIEEKGRARRGEDTEA
jgi:hypothetical protein